MSSGTRYQPDAMRNMQGALAQETMRRISNLGMSPRQQYLNKLWSYFCAAQYESRQMSWDGTPNVGMVEKELISTAASIPPGFYDAAGQMQDLPLAFRKPTAPYHLARAIVNRFTGLLFSKKRHPEFQVADDPKTQDFLHGMIEAGRLWPSMILARTYGGATGSVGLGFKFINGKPEIEVHDPRWTTPTFKDRSATHLELASVDKKYMYPVDVFDHEKGEWVSVPFWYRRYVDDRVDVVWPRVPVGDGDEPDWQKYMQTELVVEHDLGFCPVQWVQNTPVQDAPDGEPDCHGAFEMIEQIDALNAQADRGILMNCDPTLGIVTKDDLADISKGSDNAIKITEGSMQYLEISATGITAAREKASDYRADVLEVTQCVLDHPDVAGRTATEIERLYGSMIDKADVFREQYGERGIKPLGEKMLEAVRKLKQGRVVRREDGSVERQVSQVEVPQRVVDGKLQSRELGDGKLIELTWGPYFSSSLADATQAATAASAAKVGGLIDAEAATRFVAQHFAIDDPDAAIKAVQEQEEQEEQFLTSSLIGGGPAGGVATRSVQDQDQPEAGHQAGKASGPIAQYAMEAGFFTIDEYRTSHGYEPTGDPDGGLTLPEYRMKHPRQFLASAAAQKGDTETVAAVIEAAGGAEGSSEPVVTGPPGAAARVADDRSR